MVNVADGLICPFCSSMKSKVIDKRSAKKKGVVYIRRRRVCLNCNRRFTTYENSVNKAVEKKTIIKIVKKIDDKEIKKIRYKYIYRCGRCKKKFGSNMIIIDLRCPKCRSKDVWLM